MIAVDNASLLRQLNWRYATKQFDPKRKIADQDWQTLEKAMILAPSSWGLQPWKFVVITNPEMRKKLQPAAYGQGQIVDASHLVVLALKKHLDAADVDHFIAYTAKVRGVPVEALKQYRDIIVGSVQRPPEAIQAWNARQVYIALGFLLSAAAMLGIDACPMEGFNPKQFDEILGLDQQGYSSAVICTVGYRSSDDKYAHAAKVRYDAKDVVTHIA